MTCPKEWIDAIEKGNWKRFKGILNKYKQPDIVAAALEKCSQKDAPLFIIKKLLSTSAQKTLYYKGLLKHSIHRKSVVEAILEHKKHLYNFESDWLLCTALNHGHSDTAEFLLVKYYRKQQLSEQSSRKQSKGVAFDQTTLMLLEHFPHLSQNIQNQILLNFFNQQNLGPIAPLIAHCKASVIHIHDFIAKLHRDKKIKMSKAFYYRAVHLIFENGNPNRFGNNFPGIQYEYEFFNSSISFDFMQVKPLLQIWERWWKLSTVGDKYCRSESKILHFCGYFMCRVLKRTLTHCKYRYCKHKAMQLAFGLQHLDLPVLLKNELYNAIYEPVSNVMDLHIVDSVFTWFQKAPDCEK